MKVKNKKIKICIIGCLIFLVIFIIITIAIWKFVKDWRDLSNKYEGIEKYQFMKDRNEDILRYEFNTKRDKIIYITYPFNYTEDKNELGGIKYENKINIYLLDLQTNEDKLITEVYDLKANLLLLPPKIYSSISDIFYIVLTSEKVLVIQNYSDIEEIKLLIWSDILGKETCNAIWSDTFGEETCTRSEQDIEFAQTYCNNLVQKSNIIEILGFKNPLESQKYEEVEKLYNIFLFENGEREATSICHEYYKDIYTEYSSMLKKIELNFNRNLYSEQLNDETLIIKDEIEGVEIEVEESPEFWVGTNYDITINYNNKKHIIKNSDNGLKSTESNFFTTSNEKLIILEDNKMYIIQ